MPDESEPSRESDVPDQAKSVDAPAQWGDVLKIKDNREPRILTRNTTLKAVYSSRRMGRNTCLHNCEKRLSLG